MRCALRADDVAARGDAPAAGDVAMRGCVLAASGVGYAEVTAALLPILLHSSHHPRYACFTSPIGRHHFITIASASYLLHLLTRNGI